MTKSGANGAWLPNALYRLLAEWCAQHPDGEIRLYHDGGRITKYTVMERGQVRYTPQGAVVKPRGEAGE